MFGIGDKAVYPAHGVGEILSIERREIMGKHMEVKCRENIGHTKRSCSVAGAGCHQHINDGFPDRLRFFLYTSYVRPEQHIYSMVSRIRDAVFQYGNVFLGMRIGKDC